MHPLVHLLAHHPKLAGITGIVIALLFAVLGGVSLFESSRLPDTPTVATVAEVANVLRMQERFWVNIPNPPWDCATIVHTTVGESVETEVFLNDPANSVAILVTYTKSKGCRDLDAAQATGVAYPMSARHIQLLEQEGRLTSFRNYHTLAELCTTCGKESSLWLAVISAIMVVVGLAIYPFANWVRRRSKF